MEEIKAGQTAESKQGKKKEKKMEDWREMAQQTITHSPGSQCPIS